MSGTADASDQEALHLKTGQLSSLRFTDGEPPLMFRSLKRFWRMRVSTETLLFPKEALAKICVLQGLSISWAQEVLTSSGYSCE